MHRKIIVLGLIFITLISSVHAEYSRWLTGQVSAGTSAIYYGDESLRLFNTSLLSDGYKRFVFTIDASGGIILDKHVRFSFGSLLNYDSFSQSRYNVIYLDYNFYTGIRVYPALKGFNFGIEYVAGRRSNLVNLPLSLTSDIEANTPWGNGFRFSAEYDFMYDTAGLAPMVGVSWRCMPRGEIYDHVFSVFFKMLFR